LCNLGHMGIVGEFESWKGTSHAVLRFLRLMLSRGDHATYSLRYCRCLLKVRSYRTLFDRSILTKLVPGFTSPLTFTRNQINIGNGRQQSILCNNV
jgi:hypothetical protein